MPMPFYCVTGYPEKVNAPNIIVRMVDGLGFRFAWATEGLDEADYAFAPGEGCNSLGWMVRHIWGLTNWIHMHVIGGQSARPESLCAQRNHALEMLWGLRNHFARMTDEELAAIRVGEHPFWHMINGPMSDALTHVGQIRYVRVLMGKRGPDANVFTCEPPAAPQE